MRVPGQLYSNLFLTTSSVPELLVEDSIWNEVYHWLPKYYSIPDLDVIAPVLEQYKKQIGEG
ncbi:hypothetical protein NQ117_21095 [Paenibacillus sp. SC116]|uniref:hypothetical protein n=1 Tax=Paenibacillus sp. SC116 TaxID=2968986 RepID=UPI00215A4BDA|nr:hypothetical protein [Paenibacillus sp. SC116]MCR8846184.1 hypothetical protein [Paenibacillus sp. SC116]